MEIMKKAIILSLLLAISTATQAQTIRKGDRFFDGNELYTVQEVRMGKYVYMTSNDESEITLEKVDGKSGEYTLQPSSQAEEPPFVMSEWGWRVQYVRQDGMNFLALRRPNGDAMHIFVLTPDNLTNCLAQQEDLESKSPSELSDICLLNKQYWGRITREDLRIARNEILARHGYRFQAEDLQQYFGSKPWYHPGNDNDAIRLSIIERTNIELIRSEEALHEGLHMADVAGDVDQSDIDD